MILFYCSNRENDVLRYDSDDEDEGTDRPGEIRQGFISKVYGIVFSQLALTTVIVLLWLASKGISKFLVESTWFFIIWIIGTVVTELMILCCSKFARKVPNNYICLFVFTFFESMVVATFWAMVNDFFLVVIAASMTCIIVAALTLYAFRTKEDFTMFGATLWILVSALLITFLFVLIFQSRILSIIYRIRRCLVLLNDQHFAKFVRGLDNGDFLY